jgi:hypothetical protein
MTEPMRAGPVLPEPALLLRVAVALAWTILAIRIYPVFGDD